MKYRIVRVHNLFYVEARVLNKFLMRNWRRISPRGGFHSDGEAWRWWHARLRETTKDFEVVAEWAL